MKRSIILAALILVPAAFALAQLSIVPNARCVHYPGPASQGCPADPAICESDNDCFKIDIPDGWDICQGGYPGESCPYYTVVKTQLLKGGCWAQTVHYNWVCVCKTDATTGTPGFAYKCGT